MYIIAWHFTMDLFLMVRRQKTTLFLDVKDTATVFDVKLMIAGIIKRQPEDQKLVYEHQVMNDSHPITNYFSQARAQSPATIGLMLRGEDNKFEQLEIKPYSEPPELPAVMQAIEKDQREWVIWSLSEG